MITQGGSGTLTRAKRPTRARPDVALARRIKTLLHARGFAEASALQVSVDGGTVTLQGSIADQHQRWRCLECCRHVAGVREVIDELTVDDPTRG